MTEADAPSVDKRFYLDDLHVGQRFLSRTYLIDEKAVHPYIGCSNSYLRQGLTLLSPHGAGVLFVQSILWCRGRQCCGTTGIVGPSAS